MTTPERPSQPRPDCASPGETDRRGFLSRALLAAAGAGAAMSLEERILLAAAEDGTAGGPPKPGPEAQTLPCGQIGDLKISRMFLGGNLIGGWAHSRDLVYVSQLFKAYNNEPKVFETLALAEQQGINTILIDPVSQEVLEKYKKERGGKIQTMICVHPTTEEAPIRDQIRRLVDKGATTLYTHGHVTDEAIMNHRIEPLGRALDLIKKEGLKAGLGGHSIEMILAAEKNNLNPDYYVKTYHPDKYWSATPEAGREEWCWYKGLSSDHDKYHDNMFCLDAEKTAAVMETVKKPWVAFKVLAAGAIPPRIGFTSALRNGADFLCVGMFDFQIVDNVKLANEVLAKINERKRAWCA